MFFNMRISIDKRALRRYLFKQFPETDKAHSKGVGSLIHVANAHYKDVRIGDATA
jgi:hypothetical protein